MKLDTMVMIILVVGLTFAIVGGIANDFKIHYPEVQAMNDTSWSMMYNNASQLNASISGLQDDIIKLGSESSGWTKLLGGLSLIWNGIATTFILVVGTPIYIISIISSLAKNSGMPEIVSNTLLPIIIVMIISSVIFMLIKFWHRGE